MLFRQRRPIQSGEPPQQEVARITADLKALQAQAGCEGTAPAAIGVCAPGPLDSGSGRILNPPNLPGWADVPICDWLTREFGCPVSLQNDANAAALAEWHSEAAGEPSARHLIYLTMSTGIGAGLVLDGRIHSGRFDLAGEIGHSPVVWDGEPCPCGLRGCLETYIGGAAWTRRLRQSAPESSRVVVLAGSRADVRPEHVVEAAKQGDAFALAELEQFNELLSRAIVQLTFTLSPDVVVLGTIATAAGDALCLEPVRRKVRARLWPRLAEGLTIRAASLGEELPYRAGLCVAGTAGQGAPAR